MNKVKVTYCSEDLKYRIFGLFPYFALDCDGNMALYKGNTTQDGCYGQISCALKMPQDFVCGESILKKGDSFTYNTLMHYYRNCKNDKTNDFVKFMERGIGVIQVNTRIDWSECDLVPETINLSECADLYNDMVKMKIACDKYIEKRKQGNPINCDMECMLDKYRRMGGDTMLNYYMVKSTESETVANEYFNYADVDASIYSINIGMTQTAHDTGICDNYTDIWDPIETYYKGDIVVYDGISYICKGHFIGEVDNGVVGEWDDELCQYVFNKDYFETINEVLTDGDITLQGTTNSKLTTFRKFGDYISVSDEIEKPQFGEDWLFYYRVGYLANYTSETDDDGNVAVLEGFNRSTDIGEFDNHLMVYGDILTDITAYEKEYKLKITYVIGGHLKAKLTKVDVTELNQFKYYYGDYQLDTDDNYHGVYYTETYYYEPDGEIDELVKTKNFHEYTTQDILSGTEFYKCVFDTNSVINTAYTIVNGQKVEFTYIPSDFKVVVSKDREMSSYPLIRPDYYDGVSYTPKVTNRVRFSRGNSAAFERHLKLGEVKSFDDFLNYSNGGFFNVL